MPPHAPLAAVLALVAGLAVAGDVHARAPHRRRETRWLGPQGIPLAVSGPTSLRPAPDDACMRWGTRGSRWLAIDAWGQEVGRAKVTQGASMDSALDACFYPTLDAASGAAGVVHAS